MRIYVQFLGHYIDLGVSIALSGQSRRGQFFHFVCGAEPRKLSIQPGTETSDAENCLPVRMIWETCSRLYIEVIEH